MECCGSILSDTKRLAHFDGEATHESGVLVVNECLGESYMFEHMFQVEFGNSFSRDVSLHGTRMTALVHLWSVIVSIESKPFDSGNLTMKSIATVLKGNTPGFANIGLKGALLV